MGKRLPHQGSRKKRGPRSKTRSLMQRISKESKGGKKKLEGEDKH